MYLRFSFIAPHLLIKCECVRYKGLWSESQDRATILNAFTMDKSYNLPHFLHLRLVNIEVHLSKEKHLCHLRQSKCVVEHMHNYSFIIPHNTILSRNRQGSTIFSSNISVFWYSLTLAFKVYQASQKQVCLDTNL